MLLKLVADDLARVEQLASLVCFAAFAIVAVVILRHRMGGRDLPAIFSRMESFVIAASCALVMCADFIATLDNRALILAAGARVLLAATISPAAIAAIRRSVRIGE